MSKEYIGEKDEIGKIIGTNLRQFRLSKGMSMESLAYQIGISKLTLLKIEQGSANPTLSVIWKIAKGLNVSISTLLSMESDVFVARKADAPKLMSSDQVFVAEPLFRSHGFELYRGYLKPQSEYSSEAHQKGVMEFVTIMSGQLALELDDATHHLNEHDSIRFRGDHPHKYINHSCELTILHFVISYNNF